MKEFRPNQPIGKVTMTVTFTDEELLAYADEQLPLERATALEQQIRGCNELLVRLTQVIQSADKGDLTLGGMWRRGRWSCPPRAIWDAYAAGRLGDGLSQYLRFHIETIGCRICEASLRDLQTNDQPAEAEGRVRKIFQSSAGGLRPTSGK